MPSRKIIAIAYALALAAGIISLCRAEPTPHARGQVFTRELSGGARLEFSWDSHEKVPFSVIRQGEQVILRFDRPVALRWGSALNAAAPYVRHMETAGNGSTVILTLVAPSTARYLRHIGRLDSGNDSNGVELVQTGEAYPIAALSPPSESKPTHIRRVAGPARPDACMKLLEADTKAAAAAAVVEAAKLAELAPAAGTTTVAEAARLAALSPAAGGAPLPAVPAPPVPAAAVPTLPASQAVATPPAPPAVAEKATIPLPFKDDEPFAVFTLRKNLWIISPNHALLSPEVLSKAGAPFVKDAHALSDAHAGGIILSLDGDVSAAIEKASPEGVRLVLTHGPVNISRALLPTFDSSDKGQASLVIAAGKAANILSLHDPATGVLLNVVPTDEPGVGIVSLRSFVQFNLLPSAQGIAIEQLSDAISIALQKDVVTVSAQGGLAVSPETLEQFKESESEASVARLPPTLFPYARWKLSDEKDFVPEQLKLYHEIAFSKGDAANKARLRLLGLYLGEGLFPEALGMSDDILRSSLKFYRENKVSALRGAAHFFLYRINEAQRDFAAPELKDDREAAFWHTLCDELLGEGKETFDFAANYDRYISHYPPSFIGKLAIIAADRSINRKDYDAAGAIFETIKRDNYDEPVKKYVDYMRAKVLSETHGESEAAKIWEEQAKDLSDPLIRARAEFSLINMLLKTDKISHEDAMKRLERLRIVWRGDSLELGVLTLLGNLYLEDKQYAGALHTMRDIVLYYPEVPEAVTTARQMEQTFVTLYNKDGADTMPPLEALSLFYEFRDLVPLGAPGDQMIRNLADRLVKIDLLDRAAMLLDHQIKNRLQGEERSRVGARLAQIYLMSHQPDKALETLKTTGYGELPPDLQLMRIRLTAQALAQQGKVAKAIDVISTDTSPEGTQLRLSIYWDNKDWPNVVSTAEDILGNRNDPSAALSTPESEVLLKLATAYVYEHDTGQLQYLHDYFTPLMKNNPNRDSFLFITSESGPVDYDSISNLDQDISTVKTFLKNAEKKDEPGKNGMSSAAN